jgi:uncharacterized DUF497 family protein
MSLAFEWDNRKARTNLEKHGVSFVEAVSVFNDPLARIFADEDHVIGEPREIVIGHSASKKLLVICFTEPVKERVRIISARPVTRREQHDYEENLAS